jgi:Zn-dependent peptidase ImmA (M78 family)
MALSAAERLLQSFGVEEPEEIDLEAIAWRLGAIVKRRPLDGCEAMIVGNNNNAVICVNCRSIPSRQRFSIGHELGHWFLHKGRLLFCSGREIDRPVAGVLGPEQQADAFASDLLLPNYILRPAALAERRLNLKVARDLAERFKASLSATLSKLVALDRFPIMIVRHGPTGRTWFSRPSHVRSFWFPREDLDAESPAFELLFRSGQEDAFPRKIGADAWFEFDGADHYEVQEQSFVLPNNEIMTLLIVPDAALQ